MTALGAPSSPVSRRPSASLLDAVDRIVDKGAVLSGDLVLSIADVDLVVVDLRVLVCAVETIAQADLRQYGPRAARPRARAARAERRWPAEVEAGAAASVPVDFAAARNQPPSERAAFDPETTGRSVAKLALTLIEFLRRLLERQAIRRMEGGLVDDESIERLGLTLGRLEDRVQELKRVFKLEGETLDLDLGPLGRLNGPAEAGA